MCGPRGLRTLGGMTTDIRLDALDARVVLRAYAIVAGAAGVLLAAWGPMWLGANAGLFPWDQAVLIRLFGAIVVGAGMCAWALATGDALAGRRGLAWFIGAHGAVAAMLIIQIAGPLHHPAAVKALWVLLAVILGLVYGLVSQGLPGLTPREPVASLEATRTRYEQQIRQAVAQEERHRLARDLHDAVKQQIFAIQTAAAAAEVRLGADPSGAHEALAQVRQSAREAMSEMEAMLDQLRASPLENATLIEGIRKAAEALAFRTGARVDLHVGTLPESRTIAPGTHHAIFRVVQEALANVARHARAQRVDVRIAAADGHLTVAVEDDGAGIDATRAASGMGIQNMRARAAEAGGSVELAGGAHGGTLVTLSVPYEAPEMLAAQRRKALMMIVVFANASALTLLGLVTRGLVVTSIFLLLFLAALAHNVMRYRRFRRRESAA
jgi:signal transduction histidine kinase